MLSVDAAVLSTRGGPRPYARHRPIEVETLHLAEPGPGEVLVRVATVGLCHSDLSVIDGARPRPLPMVLGHEGAGVVVEVGDDVPDLVPGDHVVFTFVPACGSCLPCQSGRPALCTRGAAANGAGTLLSGRHAFRRPDGEVVHQQLGVSCLATHTVAAANSLVKVPAALPLDRAALFGCALLTGIGAVVNTAQVPVGASVVVLGLGGVGLAAILGARLAGAHPIIGIDPVPGKRATAEAVGATVTLEPGPDTAALVGELTGGGADFAFEAVGSASAMAAAFAATGRGGTTVAVGLPHPTSTLQLPALQVVAEERRLLGSYMGSAVPRRDIPRLVELHLAGRLPLDDLVSAQLTLTDLNEGFDALADGRAVRQLVTIAPVTRV